MRTWLIVGLAACGGSAVPAPVPVPTALTPRPHAHYDIRPSQLGDPGVFDRLPNHVRLRQLGPARLRVDGPSFSGDFMGSEPATQPLADPIVVPVVGETRTALRVVSDLDDARLAVWIARADAAPAVVARRQLTDATGHADATFGVWLEPGVAIHPLRCEAGRCEVELVDPALRATGWIDAAASGTLWVGPVPSGPDKPAHGDRSLPGFESIFDGPSAHARRIARTELLTRVHPIASGAGWVEIELRRPGIRVHGFVPEAAFDAELGDFGTLGHGSGTGYGVSDSDQFDIPAGACLYDLETDEIVGVNVTRKTRHGNWLRGTGFARVYAGTTWGVARVRVRDLAGGADPARPRWESCHTE